MLLRVASSTPWGVIVGDVGKAESAEEPNETGVWPFLIAGLAVDIVPRWLTVAEVSGAVSWNLSWKDVGDVGIGLFEIAGQTITLGGAAAGVLIIYQEFGRKRWLGKLGKVLAFVWLGLQSLALAVFALAPELLVYFHAIGEGFSSNIDTWNAGTSLAVNWLQVTAIGGLLLTAWVLFKKMKKAEDGISVREAEKAKEAEGATYAERTDSSEGE